VPAGVIIFLCGLPVMRHLLVSVAVSVFRRAVAEGRAFSPDETAAGIRATVSALIWG